MNYLLPPLLVCMLLIHMDTGAKEEKIWPLRFGVDDAGGPHPLHERPETAALFRELGFDLWITHFLPPAGRYGTKEQQLDQLRKQGIVLEDMEHGEVPDMAAVFRHIRSVDAWCGENNLQWIANLESANWIASYQDGLGHEWYHQPDGRHFFRFPDDVLAELSRAKNLLGVLFDEPEHMQNSCDPSLAERAGIAGLGRPFMYDPHGDALEDASERFTAAVAEEGRRYRAKGLRLFTEHVFPVLFHPFARAGYTAAPKILKESWSPVAIACAMGAAIQYETELWITPDLWGMNGYPSHTPEAYRSALLLAYHLGADCIYTENLAYDHERKGYGSLVLFSDDGYTVTPHGEVTKWFIHEYVPEHPRYYTFHKLRPRVAIIRQPDACWGQHISWLPDTLFGHPDWQSTEETKAWFAIWHLLTRGVVPAEGLTWHCNIMAGRPQQVFAPLDGVVVFDHLVGAKHLVDVEAIFLTGIGISPEALDAVEQRVREGATCFAPPHLAPEHIRQRTGGNGVAAQAEGRWVVADTFLADIVREQAKPFIPAEEEIRYCFGETTVLFKMNNNDPNRILVAVE